MFRHIMLFAAATAVFVLLPWLKADAIGARVHYVGGTGASLTNKSEVNIQLENEDDLVLESKGATLRIPYSTVNVLEYGEKVERRVAEAVLISPLMLLSKKRTHFLTIGYADVTGHQQAAVFRVDQRDIRMLLVGLEARTGRKVEYQDDEARHSGKG
jgi:hypothetical protein